MNDIDDDGTIRFKFDWEWCDHCRVMMVICPKCGNNCCNAGYGPNTGNPETDEKCDVCSLAYQYQDLAYKTHNVPIHIEGETQNDPH